MTVDEGTPLKLELSYNQARITRCIEQATLAAVALTVPERKPTGIFISTISAYSCPREISRDLTHSLDVHNIASLLCAIVEWNLA